MLAAANATLVSWGMDMRPENVNVSDGLKRRWSI